ncbi:MAG: hypothetical protein HRU19_29550 [Pseudobacteriovorax sp.]|nr:hypothetical protein [Pseudobacteriovorax sp.]
MINDNFFEEHPLDLPEDGDILYWDTNNTGDIVVRLSHKLLTCAKESHESIYLTRNGEWILVGRFVNKPNSSDQTVRLNNQGKIIIPNYNRVTEELEIYKWNGPGSELEILFSDRKNPNFCPSSISFGENESLLFMGRNSQGRNQIHKIHIKNYEVLLEPITLFQPHSAPDLAEKLKLFGHPSYISPNSMLIQGEIEGRLAIILSHLN